MIFNIFLSYVCCTFILGDLALLKLFDLCAHHNHIYKRACCYYTFAATPAAKQYIIAESSACDDRGR